MVLYVLKNDEVEVVFKFNGLGDRVINDTGESGFFSEEAIEIVALADSCNQLIFIRYSGYCGGYSWRFKDKLNKISVQNVLYLILL